MTATITAIRPPQVLTRDQRKAELEDLAWAITVGVSPSPFAITCLVTALSHPSITDPMGAFRDYIAEERRFLGWEAGEPEWACLSEEIVRQDRDEALTFLLDGITHGGV